MGYILAWLVYFGVAISLVVIFHRYFEGLLPRAWGLALRVLLCVILFTPWFVEGDARYVPVPACIAVLFNVMAHSSIEALKALLSLLFTGVVASGILLFWYKPNEQE